MKALSSDVIAVICRGISGLFAALSGIDAAHELGMNLQSQKTGSYFNG